MRLCAADRLTEAWVAVVITPWNAPLMLATWRVAPALAAGNSVVLKPPEWAPLTASLFADIAHEAGLPAGVFNIVQGIGEEIGADLQARAASLRTQLAATRAKTAPGNGASRRTVSPVVTAASGCSCMSLSSGSLSLCLKCSAQCMRCSLRVLLGA